MMTADSSEMLLATYNRYSISTNEHSRQRPFCDRGSQAREIAEDCIHQIIVNRFPSTSSPTKDERSGTILMVKSKTRVAVLNVPTKPKFELAAAPLPTQITFMADETFGNTFTSVAAQCCKYIVRMRAGVQLRIEIPAVWTAFPLRNSTNIKAHRGILTAAEFAVARRYGEESNNHHLYEEFGTLLTTIEAPFNSTLQPMMALATRQQWHYHHTQYQVINVVLVFIDIVPPKRWDMGRIEAAHPGGDGRIQNETGRGLYERTVHHRTRNSMEEHPSEVVEPVQGGGV